MKNNIAAVVLAAGEGKRMKSALPKVLHPVCGKPMLEYPLKMLDELGIKQRVIVIGHGREEVKKRYSGREKLIIQEKQLGTGHAVLQTSSFFNGIEGDILILSGDVPLLHNQTIKDLINYHQLKKAAATVLTTILEKPAGYGRIIRGEFDNLKAIVEERDATDEQRKVHEINSGTYIIEKRKLFEKLGQLDCRNEQGEYYLTDIIGILKIDGEMVAANQVKDSQEILGVNSREQLAEVSWIMKEKINKKHMDNGVTIIDPAVTYIDDGVEIGRDTVIQPFSFIKGQTVIGNNCQLGPNINISDSTLGNEITASFGVIRGSTIGNKVTLGPFFSLRPGTIIADEVHIGTSVEIKKSMVGRGSKIPHLSYIGDAEIGSNVNIGAGSITCNYDGVEKQKTIIEDEAFIGSDTMLVAPVKIGKKAMTGAGSAISKDIPENSLGLERSEQRNIPGYREKIENKKKEKKKREK